MKKVSKLLDFKEIIVKNSEESSDIIRSLSICLADAKPFNSLYCPLPIILQSRDRE